MDGIVVELELSPEQYEQLIIASRSRRLAVVDAAHVALTEWLDREAKLARARSLMSEMGQGLGEGLPPHDVARQHDVHLYRRRDR